MDIKIVEYDKSYSHVVRESVSFSNAQEAAHYRDNSDFAGKNTKLEYDYESEYKDKSPKYSGEYCENEQIENSENPAKINKFYHVFWEGWIIIALLIAGIIFFLLNPV